MQINIVYYVVSCQSGAVLSNTGTLTRGRYSSTGNTVVRRIMTLVCLGLVWFVSQTSLTV